jgi:hypothetical protein
MTSGNKLTLNVYLKHFTETVINQVLSEAGYSSMIEYEVLCRQSDIFPVHFEYNGLMKCQFPVLDPSMWRVFEFSLHHLSYEVRTLILEKYIGMSLIDYETQYPEYNNIYVYIPYKSCFSNYSTEYQQFQPLSGWYFRLNKRTGKSYVLHRNDKVLGVYDNYVQYSDGTTIDAVWNLYMTGLDHPLYYNTKSKGFLIGTRFREQLLNYGAVYVDQLSDTPYCDDFEEPLRGWNYWVNPSTLNSFLLAPVNMEFKKVKNGYAYFGDEKYPTKWIPHGMILNKPFYFSKTHKAWIVSSNLEERILDCGANLRDFFQSHEQDTMPLCERFAKQEKKCVIQEEHPDCESLTQQKKKSSSKFLAETQQLLTEMQFCLNSKTFNSYILAPKEGIRSIDDDYVYSGSKKFKKQLTYDVMGEQKTFYYSDNFKGWIVSLKFKNWLLDNGAKLI